MLLDEEDHQNRAAPTGTTHRSKHIYPHPKSNRYNFIIGNHRASNARGRRQGSPAPFSILEAHHKTNRKIRPPNPEQLNQGRAGNRLRPHNSTQKDHVTNTVNDADNEASEGEQLKPRMARKPKGNSHGPKPTQLRFYCNDRVWRNVLQNSKYAYRRYIHISPPGFPERNEKTLDIAGDFLLDVIADHERKKNNAELDHSEYSPLFFSLCMTLFLQVFLIKKICQS